MGKGMRKRMRMSRKKTYHPNGGFTLLEVLLSVGILAIVSLPLLRFFTDSMRYSSMTVSRQQAVYLAQEITEGLLAERRLVVEGSWGAWWTPSPSYSYTVPFINKACEEGFFHDFNVVEDVIAGDKIDKLLRLGEGTASFQATVEDGSGSSYDVVVTISLPSGASVGGVQNLSDYIDNTVPSTDKLTLLFSVCTEVYPVGSVDENDRLAMIKTMKGE